MHFGVLLVASAAAIDAKQLLSIEDAGKLGAEVFERTIPTDMVMVVERKLKTAVSRCPYTTAMGFPS